LVKECEKSIINLEPKNHTTKTTKSKTSKNNSNRSQETFYLFIKYNPEIHSIDKMQAELNSHSF